MWALKKNVSGDSRGLRILSLTLRHTCSFNDYFEPGTDKSGVIINGMPTVGRKNWGKNVKKFTKSVCLISLVARQH
jgi:hypothetical protein